MQGGCLLSRWTRKDTAARQLRCHYASRHVQAAWPVPACKQLGLAATIRRTSVFRGQAAPASTAASASEA